MTSPIYENQIMYKLKQTILDKEYSKKYHEILNTNIKLNKNQKLTQVQTISNGVLPSIVQSKVGLIARNKSQSAKRLSFKANQVNEDLVRQKKDSMINNNQRSMKSLKLSIDKQSSKKKQQSNKDIQNLIIKKQLIVDNSLNKVSQIRTKIYSMKTPQPDTRYNKESNNPTRTKDITAFRSSSIKQQSIKQERQRQRQSSIKQFNSQMQLLNHDYILEVRNGSISAESQINRKFYQIMNSFKEKGVENYNKIIRVIEQINVFCSRYKIQTGIIQFNLISNLPNKQKYSNYEMVNLFNNKNHIITDKKIIGLEYYTIPQKKGKDLAASRIISFFKMIYSRKFYKNFRKLITQVRTIQKYWRNCLLIRRTRKAMMNSFQQKIKKSQKLQKQLIKNWSIIKSSVRFEVHISSYCMQNFKRFTMKQLIQRENTQITRIFKATETDVHIIYILPYQISQQLTKYYNSIFNFNTNVKILEKIYFITPQNYQRLDEYNLNMISKLLYSPKAIRRIKQIIGKQYAYIVPSFPSVQYKNLSAELNIPVFSSNQNLQKYHSTKSGCLKIFKPVSLKEKPPFLLPKSVTSIFSQRQLINSLAILIHKNKHIKMWYLKIEDEIQSRGIAYLNINKISFLRELCSKQNTQMEDMYEDNQIIKLIVQQLKVKLPSRLKILNKDIYNNYQTYINHFLTRGGIIQAGIEGQRLQQFSISFLIDPNGQFNVIGTYNKLELNGKSINQAIKVPSIIQGIDYSQIVRNLYKEIYQKNKFFGYFTADFISSQLETLPYAIGLDCFLNEKTSSLFMINYCTNSKFNKDKNSLVLIPNDSKDKDNYSIMSSKVSMSSISTKQQIQHYIYCPIIKLANPPPISLFFKNCKYENISYDLEKKIGTIFILIDKIENEQIGFLCVEKDMIMLLRLMKNIVEYFSKKHRQGKNSHDQIGLLKGVVTTWLKKYDRRKQKVEECI